MQPRVSNHDLNRYLADIAMGVTVDSTWPTRLDAMKDLEQARAREDELEKKAAMLNWPLEPHNGDVVVVKLYESRDCTEPFRDYCREQWEASR